MFWILTLQVRFERKESMSWMKLGFIGIFMSFWTSPSCQTRSKALSMSKKTARVCSFRLACRVVSV
jgi:hypothetical protein